MQSIQDQQAGTLAELIKERRTIRQFRNDPVPMELLIELLNVAVWAPTHGHREPWRFVLYKDEARKPLMEAVIGKYSAEEKLRLEKMKREYFMGIPIHLVVIMKEDPRQKQWDEDYGSVCCWIQNFQLAAWEAGIGVVWKTNPFIYHPSFREAVGVEPGERVVGLLHVGYPEVVPAARPRTDARAKLIIHDTI